MTKEEAAKRIADLSNKIDEIYAEISELGVEHQIEVYVPGPDYGMGGHLNLEDSDDEWGGVTEAGTWTSSSSMC